MTDSQKLDLLLEKMDSFENKMDSFENRMDNFETELNKIKRQMLKHTAELKAMDEIILDEVERVHAILDKHKANKSIHSA